VSLAALQRALVLAAVALLAAVLAVAIARSGDDDTGGNARAVPVADGGWYTALAGSRGAPSDAERTACGQILTSRSLGVSHPVLPCGAKLYLEFGGREVLTEVIDRGPKEAGRQFDLTEALAQSLGLEGTQEIRWRFATRA
jgi:hypothetical protein